MESIHYSNCFMCEYNHYPGKLEFYVISRSGVYNIPYRFQTDCTHKSFDITFLKSYLSHTFSMVEAQRCPSTIEMYGKTKVLKMSYLLVYHCNLL